MEKIAEQFVQLKELLIEYFDSNVEYYKFAGFEKLMQFVVALTFAAVFFILLMLALFLFGFSAAIWLGDMLENEAAGYLGIGFFYLFLLLLVYLLKKPLIERPLIKFFHRFLFKKENKNNEPS
ncbi:hypothetical protein QUH73_09855 [Labilibaculum sp. K2S]|uniref:hypothetical protein n=1 Tax=Labilibaculum sp. K2S TaxID=3056386 RepID=UPI0025A41F08|nr:hypothetical protein [Labilibaculum sp. K2S]MDM8160116.1 hypothetical protein [Labilibaculum sp. K2S]